MDEEQVENLSRKELMDIIFDKNTREDEQMTEKELKHLNKRELIEIIYELKVNEEKLQKELESAKAALEDRNIRMENAGSIAEASLAINGVFEKAQAAADEYLAAIKVAQSDSEKKIEQAQLKADRIMQQVELESDLRLKKTDEMCSAKIAEANQSIDLKWEEFQKNVEQILSAHAELTGLLGRK